jgi:hypothetical protein
MTTQPSDLSDILQRLQRIEDERAVLHTLHRYAHCIDYGLEDEWVDLFTEDGVYNRFTTGIRHEGREEIRKFIPTHTRAPEKYHKHFMVEPIITLNGDEATAESYWARVDDGDSGPFILSFGRYRDHLVRCPDGRWRFKERRIERENRVFTQYEWRTPPAGATPA